MRYSNFKYSFILTDFNGKIMVGTKNTLEKEGTWYEGKRLHDSRCNFC